MGGSKKSSLKPAPKRKPKLDKLFQCPMCSQEGAACTITKEGKDYKNAFASIRCPACMEGHKFRGNVTYLTEPIDIYSDWIDFIANPTAKKRTMLIAPKPKMARTHFEEDEEDGGARKPSSAAQASKKQPSKSKSSSAAKSGKKKIVQEDDSEEEEEFDNEESEIEETRPRSAQADDDDDEEEYF